MQVVCIRRRELRSEGPGVKTGHPSASGRATRTSSGLRAVSFVAVILALGLKVPLNRGEDHATMCAPHLPSPRVVRH